MSTDKKTGEGSNRMNNKGSKLVRGLDVYDMLINFVLNLTPVQAERLYKELLPRYTNRGRVSLYNELGELCPDGLIRLMPFQYQSIRTKFGDSYIKKAFSELSGYIKYLKENVDYGSNKSKLNRLSQGTHNTLLTDPSSWLYKKCRATVVNERPKLNLNPYLIDDYNTALEYIKSIPQELWKDSYDVQSLILKFPELNQYING